MSPHHLPAKAYRAKLEALVEGGVQPRRSEKGQVGRAGTSDLYTTIVRYGPTTHGCFAVLAGHVYFSTVILETLECRVCRRGAASRLSE